MFLCVIACVGQRTYGSEMPKVATTSRAATASTPVAPANGPSRMTDGLAGGYSRATSLAMNDDEHTNDAWRVQHLVSLSMRTKSGASHTTEPKKYRKFRSCRVATRGA